MTNPILTLTTDFGLSDHYVGVMKGVILSICPQAQIVDISHEVTPHEIQEGAYLIAQAWRYFPKKTVHVVVVDPGVGSARRPLLMEAGGQYFLAPDNAAHIAAGVPATRVGKPILDYLKPVSEKPQRCGKRTWVGKVLKIDRFGNVVTSFHVNDFPYLERQDFTLSVGPVATSVLARNYTECSPGELFVIIGSGGYYEVSLSQGSASKHIHCALGGAVELVVG